MLLPKGSYTSLTQSSPWTSFLPFRAHHLLCFYPPSIPRYFLHVGNRLQHNISLAKSNFPPQLPIQWGEETLGRHTDDIARKKAILINPGVGPRGGIEGSVILNALQICPEAALGVVDASGLGRGKSRRRTGGGEGEGAYVWHLACC